MPARPIVPTEVTIGSLTVANNRPFALIAGPCQIESRGHAHETAGALSEIARKVGVNLIYKSSYDKANRTSINSTLVSQIAVGAVKPYDEYQRVFAMDSLKAFRG